MKNKLGYYPEFFLHNIIPNFYLAEMFLFSSSVPHFYSLGKSEGKLLSSTQQKNKNKKKILLSLAFSNGGIRSSSALEMSFIRGLIDSLGSILTDSTNDSHQQHPWSPDSPTMEAGGDDVSQVSNERAAYKIKGYFDLAKEEIAKAVRAEEWGLVEDAIVYYKTALRVLKEGISISVPSYVTSGEQEKVKSYRQKILQWQDQVSDRLQVLSRRAGTASTSQVTASHPKTAAVSLKPSNPMKNGPRNSLQSGRNTALMGIPKEKVASSKPVQESGGGYDAKLVEMINTAIVDRSPSVKWEDVAGLDKAKQALMEMVILPTKRRDLFTGLRRPARGLLLFGPPGNGKTMLAKAVASESEATFFNVSASSLTSKWVGEAEKLVRTLFMIAISRQPSVIFIDEIDSIMSTRLANENDASRRLKSEFLIQFDGVTSNPDDLVILIGATNKPQELDDAVLRRLVKRIYVPLPDESVRRLLLRTKLKGQAFSLPGGDVDRLARETEGYSGSDLQALCEEAAMMPIRELGTNILKVKANQVRPLRYDDFRKAMTVIRPSLQRSKWEELDQWNRNFGSN
ncbi:hypothetical protein SAY86_000329 [Trapa natans]|uniref:microtubule-severing ATPase n=1 Tax=Trapa natans TaxID=22666 RepID=A0AAN7RLB4_TRANT|nr:hypothetical protein SAY86_000329 [Trapa natans]